MLTFKIKLNKFDSLFCAESFHRKFPKFFEEMSEKKTRTNHLFTYEIITLLMRHPTQ